MTKSHKEMLRALVICCIAIGLWSYNIINLTSQSNMLLKVGISGVPISPITPDTLAVDLWFKADAITGLNNGDPIPTWPDSSTNNCTNTKDGTLDPTWLASAVNSKPAVRFSTTTGTTSRFLLTSCLGLTNNIEAITAFVVAQVPSSSRSAFTFSSGSATTANRFNLAINSAGGLRNNLRRLDADSVVLVASATGLFAPSSWNIHYHHMSYSTNIYKSRLNGLDITTSNPLTAGNTSATDSLAVILGGTAGADTLIGDIAEIIVKISSLTEAQYKGIEVYLACTYNFSLPYAFTCS